MSVQSMIVRCDEGDCTERTDLLAAGADGPAGWRLTTTPTGLHIVAGHYCPRHALARSLSGLTVAVKPQ